MRRLAALVAAVIAVSLLAGCTKTKPVEVPAPDWVDPDAAAEIGDGGNGLWLLDGPSAASQIIDAAGAEGGGSMVASVREIIPQDQGPYLPGRSIAVSSRTDGAKLQAEISVGDQQGELLIVDRQAWVRGDRAFVESAGALAADGHDPEVFVCVVGGSTAIAELVSLARPAEFLRTALIGLEMGVLAPAEDTPETQKLVVGSGGAPTGELTVAAQGAPLPMALFVSDQSGEVRADFVWGGAEEIRVPQDEVESCA